MVKKHSEHKAPLKKIKKVKIIVQDKPKTHPVLLMVLLFSALLMSGAFVFKHKYQPLLTSLPPMEFSLPKANIAEVLKPLPKLELLIPNNPVVEPIKPTIVETPTILEDIPTTDYGIEIGKESKELLDSYLPKKTKHIIKKQIKNKKHLIKKKVTKKKHINKKKCFKHKRQIVELTPNDLILKQLSNHLF
jgi:hypothetical protein